MNAELAQTASVRYSSACKRTLRVILVDNLNGNQATELERSMFRVMSKYTMSPDAMAKWLDQMPELIKACAEIDEDVIIEGSWVSKDRTHWFFIRALESPEANRRFVDKLKAGELGQEKRITNE